MTTVVRGATYANSYRDSVELMGIAAELERLPGIVRAGLVMATPANLGVLAEAGMTAAAAEGVRPSDMIVAIAAETDEAAAAALARADELLTAGASGGGGTEDEGTGSQAAAPSTLRDALERLPEANLALISTPGTYATAEAVKALKHGLNVFLFSDNVSVEDELELKRLAAARGLLVMGPDCGTAIVGGIPLGFANAVRRGPIGIAAASGTGLQQVSTLVHRYGSGISHALGTGGRDLDERIGGSTMLAATKLLLDDPSTTVVVLISKPPSARVAAAILEAVRDATKPVVVTFLGGDPAAIRAVGAHPAATFEEAARLATRLAGWVQDAGGTTDDVTMEDAATNALAAATGRLVHRDATIVGLYSGGSLAGEAKLVLKGALGPGRHDRIIDLGDDEYTVGRPHPMIDPRLRNEHIVATGDDPGVGVLLLDVVLGYGSNSDPAGAMVPAILDARQRAASAGRHLAVVGSVVGTDEDPQGLALQERLLKQAGVALEGSNARAAGLAAAIIVAARGSATAGGTAVG